MKCENCGANLCADTNRCQYCGTYRKPQPPPQPQPQTVVHNVVGSAPSQQPACACCQPSDKNKWVALFLCLFFGWLGFHKIYVGKVGMGIVYLLTGGLFFVGIFFDLIFILLGRFTDKWGRRLV